MDYYLHSITVWSRRAVVSVGRTVRAQSITLAVLAYLFGMSSLQGAPKLRFQVDQRGDMLMIGNTLAQECRTDIPIPQPVVGTVGDCGTIGLNDSSPDVLWRAEDNGSANANIGSVIPLNARSSAQLKLPPGAQVTYARMYWGANLGEDPTDAVSTVTVDRLGPGGFSQAVMAAPVDVQVTDGGAGYVYGASADVTSLLQKRGEGAYRVTGPARVSAVNVDSDVQYAAWSMVVFYKQATGPVRNLALYDGLGKLVFMMSVDVNISGFLVPSKGGWSGKLGVIAYEGDVDKNDFLKFNGQALTDANNPADNFFNSSRSNLGTSITTVGDLPQLTGSPGSMSGLDMDVVDITPFLKADDSTAMITVGSVNDIYFLQALTTSVTSTKPVFETTLTYPQGTSTRPGDTIELTSTTVNPGDDTGIDVSIWHQIPPGLTYVPGSVRFVGGPDIITNGPKTDVPGDDQADYESLNNTLHFRIGTGASAAMGGSLAANDKPVVFKFLVRIDDNAVGDIPTQSTTSGSPALNPAMGPSNFPSGNGVSPGAPTVISVPPCARNADCSVTSPVCNRTVMPPRCSSACVSNADCQGAPGGQEVCSPKWKRCVQCSPVAMAACSAAGLGAACLDSGTCGCQSDADCGGRSCDVGRAICPYPAVDLALEMATYPTSLILDEPASVLFTVTNLGPISTAGSLSMAVHFSGAFPPEKIVADSRWHCSLIGQHDVACLYPYTLAPKEPAPQVNILISSSSCSHNMAQQCSFYEEISASVYATHAIDSAPENNSIKTIRLLHTPLAEPIGCAVHSGRASPTALVAALAAALLLGAAAYRGSRRAAARILTFLLACWACGCGPAGDTQVEIVNWPSDLAEVYLVPTRVHEGQYIFGKTIRIPRAHPSVALVYPKQYPCDLQLNVIGVSENTGAVVTGRYVCPTDSGSGLPNQITINLEERTPTLEMPPA